MTETVKNIIPRKFAENAQTSQYTAVDCKTIITKFTATNNSGVTVALSINLVQNGGSASAANRVLNTRAISSGECYICHEVVGQVLEAGGFISTLASAASAITISAAGSEIT